MKITWNRKVPVGMIIAGILLGFSAGMGYIHIVPAIAIIIGLGNISITLR